MLINAYSILEFENDIYKKMVSIVENCRDLKVSIPEEVYQFFAYRRISIEDIINGEIQIKLPMTDISVDGYTYIIDMSKIPKLTRFLKIEIKE